MFMAALDCIRLSLPAEIKENDRLTVLAAPFPPSAGMTRFRFAGHRFSGLSVP
jgi:hypothetical protein